MTPAELAALMNAYGKACQGLGVALIGVAVLVAALALAVDLLTRGEHR